MGSNLSITDIANMALDYLEEAPIVSIDDNLSVARWMKRNFWPVAWGLMRKHPWNFTTARASLPALATAPAFGWSYAYTVPPDCLRVLPLTSDGSDNGTEVPFKVEGGTILTNQGSPLPVRYISRISDTGLFDNNFCDALAVALAQKAAHFITGKQSYAQSLQPILTNALSDAQMIDALEGTPDDPIDDYWINARQ